MIPLNLILVTLAPGISQTKAQVDEEHKVDSRTYRAGSDVWRAEIWEPQHKKDDIPVEQNVKFFKNDHLIRRATAAELKGTSLEFGKAKFPTQFPLIVIRAEPAMGHPGPVNLFSLRNGKLVAMGRVDGEAGGPIFRDYDGDGKREWVFDDYNWYVYYGKHPKYYVVYKEQADGTLKRWKRLPNRERRRLPANLGLDHWDE